MMSSSKIHRPCYYLCAVPWFLSRLILACQIFNVLIKQTLCSKIPSRPHILLVFIFPCLELASKQLSVIQYIALRDRLLNLLCRAVIRLIPTTPFSEIVSISEPTI